MRAIGTTVAALLIGACSGGGGGGSKSGPVFSEEGLAPPTNISIESANGAVRIDWQAVSGALSYQLFWSTSPNVDPDSASSLMILSPPAVIPALSGTFYTRIATVDAEGRGKVSKETSAPVALGSPTKYFPSWHTATPKNVIAFNYDSSKTTQENGTSLAITLAALQPGDRIEIGSGRYTMTNAFRLVLRGTAADPIWIVAKNGATPVIARDDANQNTIELGNGGLTEFVALRGIEITGGDIALRLYDARQIWIDQCNIHHCNANAIAANSVPNEYLYFTRNEVHHTSGTGEGFYIGGNYGNPVARYCVIAMNHVHDCGGSQGDGIEIKQGSYGNWIAENLVHDTNYPCILVYGTGGKAINVIERNVCYGSGDNVMQVQGEALVRNNALFNGGTGFHSGDHQGSTRNLVVVHNTILNSGTAVNLSNWSGRTGMVFSNNACYSSGGVALRFSGGASGVQVKGNVVFGSVLGISTGFVTGAGLTDFQNASFNGAQRNVTPTTFGALMGSADDAFAELDQLDGSLRLPPFDSGASERD